MADPLYNYIRVFHLYPDSALVGGLYVVESVKIYPEPMLLEKVLAFQNKFYLYGRISIYVQILG